MSSPNLTRGCAICQREITMTSLQQCCLGCIDKYAPPPPEYRDALFSECGNFRYILVRGSAPYVLFIGLNPSSANAEDDDPTSNRWRLLAHDMGCHGFIAVNMYSYIATDPKKLIRANYPVGEETDELILRCADMCEKIVLCWGSSGKKPAVDRAVHVMTLLGEREFWCWGVNKDGMPQHPLMLPKDAKVRRFET